MGFTAKDKERRGAYQAGFLAGLQGVPDPPNPFKGAVGEWRLTIAWREGLKDGLAHSELQGGKGPRDEGDISGRGTIVV